MPAIMAKLVIKMGRSRLTAPLGRAVVGGLALATIATLFILPAVFAMLASKKATSASLDPDDEESALFEGTTPVLHHRVATTEN